MLNKCFFKINNQIVFFNEILKMWKNQIAFHSSMLVCRISPGFRTRQTWIQMPVQPLPSSLQLWPAHIMSSNLTFCKTRICYLLQGCWDTEWENDVKQLAWGNTTVIHYSFSAVPAIRSIMAWRGVSSFMFFFFFLDFPGISANRTLRPKEPEKRGGSGLASAKSSKCLLCKKYCKLLDTTAACTFPVELGRR